MSSTAPLRDLNKLNTFVRVAQRRSFTRAAAELRTAPSVISKRIKELEEALGFTLLNRSTHGLTLTDAGEGCFGIASRCWPRSTTTSPSGATSRPDRSAPCAFWPRATTRSMCSAP